MFNSDVTFTLYHKSFSRMRNCIVFIFVLCFSAGNLFAQEINQKDANGLRQGVWKKKYPRSSQLRYEGQFKDNKEIGTFKFYCENCGTQPFCVKEFTGDGMSLVSYFTKEGALVSKGKMKEKKRVGEWLTYHENSDTVMTREFFSDGKLTDTKTVYTASGEVVETTSYVDGKKEGLSNYYAPRGILLKKVTYKNDLLHGPAVYYSAKGRITMEGNYKEGVNHGIWKYYKEGRFLFEEVFPRPEDKN